MQVVYVRCAGLDVHKKTVSACVSVCEAEGTKRQQTRMFGTFTQDLLRLADWLKEWGVTHVAMEATSVYWRPIWAVLEGQFEQMLVNPQHIKAVPGRKTDTKDCEWIADLLQHGLLKGSFVPPTPIQDLRDRTRYRAELRQSQNRVANRIQKLLEQANVKLSFASSMQRPDTPSVLLATAIIAGGDDPQQLAQLARGRLKVKIPQLKQALEGRVREHHRFLLAEYLDEWDGLEERIRRSIWSAVAVGQLSAPRNWPAHGAGRNAAERGSNGGATGIDPERCGLGRRTSPGIPCGAADPKFFVGRASS